MVLPIVEYRELGVASPSPSTVRNGLRMRMSQPTSHAWYLVAGTCTWLRSRGPLSPRSPMPCSSREGLPRH